MEDADTFLLPDLNLFPALFGNGFSLFFDLERGNPGQHAEDGAVEVFHALRLYLAALFELVDEERGGNR